MDDPPEGQPKSRRQPFGWFLTLIAIWWWLAKRLLIAVAVFATVWKVWSVLDRPEPLRISEETTLITEPLAEDGLPDFAAALLDRIGRGVSPKDNGAIEFWRAVGSGKVDPEYRELLFAEIGCPIPAEAGVFVPIRDGVLTEEVAAWLEARSEAEIDPELLQWQAEDVIELSQQRVAAEGTPPPIKAWVDRNTEALDLLVEAAAKPAFYSPPPNLLTTPPAPLFGMLLPAEQGLREPARGLAMRAVSRMEAGLSGEAWRDLDAILALGERLTAKPLVVPQLVGVALRSAAYDAIRQLVNKNQDPELLQAVLHRLLQMPEPRWAEEALAFGEPLATIDYAVNALYATRPSTDLDLSQNLASLEPNVMFTEARGWQKRLAELAKEPDRVKRRRLADAFEYSLDEMAAGHPPWKLAQAYFSRVHRSRMIAEFHASLMLPALSAVLQAEDRSCAQQRLALLTVALRIHRLKTGEYPTKLDALVPAPLDSLPLDPFTNQPFRYERRDEGFVLYSLGVNGADDGGSNLRGELIGGEYTPIDWFDERPTPRGPDDLVVRLPVPELELPPVER